MMNAMLPAGEYVVTIDGAELKTSTSGVCRYIELVLRVNDGRETGRTMLGALPIDHPAQKLEQIARAQLGIILRTMGIDAPDFQDAAQLVGGQVIVGIGRKNCIKSVKKIGGAA